MLDEAVGRLAAGGHLDRAEARQAALAMLEGEVPDSVIGGLLVALKMNGETVDEIAGFAQGMREARVPVAPRVGCLVDTCGTGGDGLGTFNVSTTAAFITAGCGVPVAKHGNRGVSSGCGSADMLEELGVNIEMGPDGVRRCIEQVGIGFMFAPAFHPAMRRVMPARKALGMPTIFNILGPLTNPAGARAQVLGVNRLDLVELMGRVLAELGCERAFVLHGLDGMDEFTLTAPNAVCEVTDGELSSYELTPEDLGLSRCDEGALAGGDALCNARITRKVLAGERGARLDICLANAAFALVAGGAAEEPRDAVDMARVAVESGEAGRVMERLVRFGAKAESDVPR